MLDRRSFLNICSSACGPLLLGNRSLAQQTSLNGSRIRIGQIGVGHGHATKLAVYRNHPDYEVVGIAEPDERLRGRLNSEEAFRGVPVLSQEELLNTPGLQAVLVETRIKDLLETADACISAGKHVHLDKPAGTSLRDYQQLLAKASHRKLMVQMGYMYRYNPGVLVLKEFLKNRWLGEIFEVNATMSKVVTPQLRIEHAEFAGGMMFELGCHLIDLIVGILGEPTQITPFARQSLVGNDQLMDNMLAVLEYPRATATVRSTGLEVEGGARRHLTVCGTEGTLHLQPLDHPALRVALLKPHGDYKKGLQDIVLPNFTRYVADATDMAQVIRGEKEFEFSHQHDLAVQRSVLRAAGQPWN